MDVKKDLRLEIQSKLKGQKVAVSYLNDTDKYSKQRFLNVYKGYDMLENLYVVRSFVLKKYNISNQMLEMLLRLMGLKLFTWADFAETPRRFTLNRWSSVMDSGYVNLVMDHKKMEQRIYSLNTKGRNIVVNFYEYLVGEKKIPIEPSKNPMAHKKKQVAFDKKKLAFIKKLNEMEVPKHKKKMFL